MKFILLALTASTCVPVASFGLRSLRNRSASDKSNEGSKAAAAVAVEREFGALIFGGERTGRRHRSFLVAREQQDDRAFRLEALFLQLRHRGDDGVAGGVHGGRGGQADLAAGANEALADVVKGVAEGKKAVISGFHDATGDAALNAELAKQRAFAVRDALKALGVAEDKIELKKPEETTATGSNAEARRVEVALGA